MPRLAIDVFNVLDYGILAFCPSHIVQPLSRNPCHKGAGNIVQSSELILEGDKVCESTIRLTCFSMSDIKCA